MQKIDYIQQIQDDEYSFPYHYVSNFKDNFTQTFNDTWGINYVSTIEFILDKLSYETFDSLIDIGCGDGRLTKEILSNYKEKNIQGIDYSKKAISLAKILNDNDIFLQRNIIIDKIDTTFDIAILMEVFEHISPSTAKDFIIGICNHLSSHGLLYVTVPHNNKPVEPKHYRHFTSNTIVDCFKEYFDVIEIIPFETNNYRKKVIDNLLTNKYFILNHSRLKNYIYKYYKKKLFFVDNESECNRIFVKFKKKI